MPELPVGQLLCGGFQGSTVNPQAYHLIVQHKVSSIILSRKNFSSVPQISKLIKDLQYIAMTEGNYEYPLMFAVDEEGGMMNSIFDPEYLTQFPGAMAQAATGDTQLVYEISKAIAKELRTIGFCLLLGPVLDVVTKLSHQLVGVRSFGTTVEDVIKYGRAACQGFQDGGLFTFGKHFPGIGNASVDSLLELPMLAENLDQLKELNTVPFGQLIKEGLLDGISAGGCAVPIIAPDDVHACLSPILITQLLRNELGFQGIVISECLEMDSLFHSIGLGQGVIRAVFAGCDLVMVCHNLQLQNEAVSSLKKALANGNLEIQCVEKSLRRIRKLQERLPKWSEMFPEGEKSARDNPILFRNAYPALWQRHQQLSAQAYRKSITLVRDNGAFPITQFLKDENPPEKNNILLLTPLLNPLYKTENDHDSSNLYRGEDVFKKFGELLANHPLNKDNKYNILHTTYTANGLTPLHESLIEHSQVVVILTSEASRNMYQIGIVKYVSILCGANPYSFSNNNISDQLSKPLVIIATSSPYDFFYSKSIGTSYLCCYDYTDNVLEQLCKVLMGDITAEGCIPGEKKFVTKQRKKRSIDQKIPEPLSKKLLSNKINSTPKKRWLVDEFDIQRDSNALVKLWMGNNTHTTSSTEISYQDNYFFKLLYLLLKTTNSTQKHFVVRNSSLNILYGVILTWVDEYQNIPTGAELDLPTTTKVGSILYILVDKSKRQQSIGKNLHATAIKYLLKEQNCTHLKLGCTFPMINLPNPTNLALDSKEVNFFNSVGWGLNDQQLKRKHIMILRNLTTWSVPKKIFRELMIVGVRFDICQDPEQLMSLIEKRNIAGTNSDEDDKAIKSLYMEAIKYLNNNSVNGIKIIIALEPTNQSVIGSIILFNNICPLTKFFPFINQANVTMKNSDNDSDTIIAGLIGPLIHPSYSNLTEIFRFGLICSGITFLKSFGNTINKINSCIMIGIEEDSSNSIQGINDIGFESWKSYYEYYEKKSNVSDFSY